MGSFFFNRCGMFLLVFLVAWGTGCSSSRYPELSSVPCEIFSFGLGQGAVPVRLIEYSPSTYKYPSYYYFITEKALLRDGRILLPIRTLIVTTQPDKRSRLIFKVRFVRMQGMGDWTRAEGVVTVDDDSGTNGTASFSTLTTPRVD